MKIKLQLISFCLIIVQIINAQKKLSLTECNALFLKNNLTLIAEQFNINIADAQIIQAGIWDNPQINGEINLIAPNDAKVLDIGKNGQKVLAIQQIIYTAGKKKKEVELAKTNKELAKLMLADVLRNLKFELNNHCINLYYTQLNANALYTQKQRLDTLINAYNTQVQKGNIPLKELLRLQSLQIKIINEHTALINTIQEEIAAINTLIDNNTNIEIVLTKEEINKYQQPLLFNEKYLLDIAAKNRTDILMAEKQIEAAKNNITFQQALGVPDIYAGTAYDQNGGAFRNQINLTFSIPLKLRNTNKGNILAANYQLQQTQINKKQLELNIQNQVLAAYNKYKIALENFSNLHQSFQQNFDEVAKGVFQNFKRGNLTMIEFTDFTESYLESINQILEIQKALSIACEQLNYVTNQNLFN